MNGPEAAIDGAAAYIAYATRELDDLLRRPALQVDDMIRAHQIETAAWIEQLRLRDRGFRSYRDACEGISDRLDSLEDRWPDISRHARAIMADRELAIARTRACR